MKKVEAIAKINDRLRRAMSITQINLSLSPEVSRSSKRSLLIKAIKEYSTFDPDLDVDRDHSVGIVIVDDDAFVFRFTYDDERYDYSTEVGKRTLSVMHLSEFRSLKLGRKMQESALRMLGKELG